MDPDAIKSMNKSIKQYIEAKYLFEVIWLLINYLSR
jgi:hypothetical protein